MGLHTIGVDVGKRDLLGKSWTLKTGYLSLSFLPVASLLSLKPHSFCIEASTHYDSRVQPGVNMFTEVTGTKLLALHASPYLRGFGDDSPRLLDYAVGTNR